MDTSFKTNNLNQVVDIEKVNELNLLKKDIKKVW